MLKSIDIRVIIKHVHKVKRLTIWQPLFVKRKKPKYNTDTYVLRQYLVSRAVGPKQQL